MADDAAPVSTERAMTAAQDRRWEELLRNITDMLPAGPVCVVVDGAGEQNPIVAERLAAAVHATGRACTRLFGTTPSTWSAESSADAIVVAHGPHWRAHPPRGHWDVVIWLRTPPAGNGHRSAKVDADIVIDLHDPAWPVIRHSAARLGDRTRWYLTESRAFFATRAASWDTKFGDDLPAYAAAITEAGLPRDGVVVDVGCGTGRALPALRQAVGPRGGVIAVDLTPEMLAQVRSHGRAEYAALALADARHLPLADASVDAVFAAGLLTHLPDADAGLHELARVTRPGGLLVLFHPSGRAALAARHGRTLSPDEPLAEAPLRRSMHQTGWRLTSYDDPEHRFLAIAARR
ncbi:class I SAM-dependent methyltransferase [Streptosporangium subroseum]|uniref:class I SAM-dependent methyltransferase n=1 Tax=Streptosporangium subroseum TaxID=106412 RepID=UPI003089DE45|nr:class I SAM-dependent methyltransferase [Streptosporangium subroseum]